MAGGCEVGRNRDRVMGEQFERIDLEPLRLAPRAGGCVCLTLDRTVHLITFRIPGRVVEDIILQDVRIGASSIFDEDFTVALARWTPTFLRSEELCVWPWPIENPLLNVILEKGQEFRVDLRNRADRDLEVRVKLLIQNLVMTS